MNRAINAQNAGLPPYSRNISVLTGQFKVFNLYNHLKVMYVLTLTLDLLLPLLNNNLPVSFLIIFWCFLQALRVT